MSAVTVVGFIVVIAAGVLAKQLVRWFFRRER